MKLKEWMSTKGLRASQVSQILDCSEGAISRWIAGSSVPSLEMVAKIRAATAHQVDVEDFVDEVKINAVPVAKPTRQRGRPRVSDQVIEEWLRSRGLRAVSLLCAQVPGAPFSRPIFHRYMLRLEERGALGPWQRWTVRAGGKPSSWLGASALDVSDAYRTVQALRGRPPVVSIQVERVEVK